MLGLDAAQLDIDTEAMTSTTDNHLASLSELPKCKPGNREPHSLEAI